MLTMSDAAALALAPRIWQVGPLCRAVADALHARFNPVAVRGEVSGFSRAPSGHCYFSLKDEQGQLRCALFRRAASLLDFTPREGELVEVQGQLGVYGPRGDLQLVVESLRRAGQGTLFEQFLRLKARLEAEGLFAPERKRPLPLRPRAIGLVTSPGAAALHDVLTALARRVPHIPVLLSPASVQGAQAPQELVRALQRLYARQAELQLDVVLLVRGGGSLEDLAAFNDEALARTLAQSPVPVVSGVGHETDFSIADFVADLRAPTPTAAAELVAEPRTQALLALERLGQGLQQGLQRQLDTRAQWLDQLALQLGRPSGLAARERLRLGQCEARLRHQVLLKLEQKKSGWQGLAADLPHYTERALASAQERLARAGLRLDLLDPRLVLQRGYAWLHDGQGQTVGSVHQVHAGQALSARLADGEVNLQVSSTRPN